MFTGKKIASSCSHTSIGQTHGKLSTRVTEQIIGKRKQRQLNVAECAQNKQSGDQSNHKPCTTEDGAREKVKINRKTTEERSNSKRKTINKNTASNSSKKIKEQPISSNKDRLGNENIESSEQPIKVSISKIIQNKQYQINSQQATENFEDQEEQELPGENKFLQYDEQQFERATPAPILAHTRPQMHCSLLQPQLEPPQLEMDTSKTSEYCQLGLSMDVFELQVEEIMAKQYFVV